MKQNLFVRLASWIVISLAVSAAFAQAPQPLSADFSIVSASGSVNTTGKLYFSAPKMRMDMNSPNNGKPAGPFGGKTSMIVDGSARMMYMLMTEQHMYMEFPMNQNSPAAQRMPKFEDLFKGSDPCAAREGTTCKNLGTETVNGRSCDKWLITEKSGKTETWWLDQKTRFVVRAIVGDVTTNYTNIKEGPQDAALFKVPDGYQKMGAMGRPPR